MPSVQVVYWDSTVIIDWLEGNRPERVALIEPVIRAAKNGDVLIVTSAWALAEVVRIKGQPLSDVDEQKIVDFFQQAYIQIRPLDRAVAATSRSICRQPTGTGKMLKPKDAVHVATAMHAHLARLHTFDEDSLAPFSEMFRLKESNPFVKISQPEYIRIAEPEPSQIPDSGQRRIEFTEPEGSNETQADTDGSNAIPAVQGIDAGTAVSPEGGDGQTVQEGEGREIAPESGPGEVQLGGDLPPTDDSI